MLSDISFTDCFIVKTAETCMLYNYKIMII